MLNRLDIAVIIYICFQLILGFLVSILGVVYVGKQIPLSKSWFKLYFKTVWKLRSVYSSFLVHIFDVFTDLLVIIEWFSLSKDDTPHIDPNALAINATCVLILHKMISVFVFWTKERNYRRCILQFFDLLLIEEIYVAHSKIVNKFNNSNVNVINIIVNDSNKQTPHDNGDDKKQKDRTKEEIKNNATHGGNADTYDRDSNSNEYVDNGYTLVSQFETQEMRVERWEQTRNHREIILSVTTLNARAHNNDVKKGNTDIDTTTSFKLVPSIEAVFESIPQSVLQLVFLIRTGFTYDNSTLLLISLLSIIQSIISMTN